MDKKKIREYVRDGVKKGYSLEKIKNILINYGIGRKEAGRIIEEITGKGEEMGVASWVIAVIVISGIIAVVVGFFVISFLINYVKAPEIIPDAGIENAERVINEFNQCGGMAEEDAEVCKIQVAVSLKNESLCKIYLGGKILSYTWQNKNIHLNLSANDLCWMRISEVKRVNYCGMINSSQGRSVCSQKMALLI